MKSLPSSRRLPRLRSRCLPASPRAQAVVGSPAPAVHRNRLARPNPSLKRVPRQIRGSRVAQPRLPLHQKALRQRQHAGAAKGVDREGRGLVHGHFFGAWPAGLRDRRRGERVSGSRCTPTPTAVLMDPEGKLGHLYDAKTTPEMYVIDPEGKLIYEGAIDDRPTPDVSDIKGADNYLNDALTGSHGRQAGVAMPTRGRTAAR